MSTDGTLVLVERNGVETVVSSLKMQSFNNTIESIYDFDYFESLVNIIEKNTDELERYLEQSKSHKDLYENQYGLGLQMEIQRLYLNLASSQRAFVDTLKKTISARGRKNDLEAFKASLSKEYDTNLGYKMIDGLRNFSQHQTLLPITIIQSGSELRIKVERKVILDSKDISASLRSALEANTDIDLQDLILQWKESCKALHSTVRALFVDMALEASKKLISISSLSPDPSVLMRLKFRSGNEVYELPLPLETAKRIIKLQPSL
ncbi:hypothetical protein ABXV17_26385 [Vibrio harveyi]|uniref:hypothetical protein n=1 Tax=Vibrio harveyi TaxID=669 RepID=UPI003394077C